MVKRMRIEPISTYLERYRKGGVAHPVTIANGFVYLSGLPPFDPESGEIKPQPFERQCELVLEQLKHCLEAAGSSLSQVIKCNVYCVPGATHFSTFNAVYDRFFPRDAPSRIFMFIHLRRRNAGRKSALPPKADIDQCGCNVRFVPKADILRCSKEPPYSITSSAVICMLSGTVSPSAFAVFKLTTSSNLAGS